MKNIAAGCAFAIFAIPVAAVGVLALFDPDLLETLFWYTLYGLGGLVFLAFVLAINWAHKRQQRRERTYVDGALPIMKRRRRIWRSDIPRPLALWSFLVGEEFYIDPNRMISPAWSFDAFGRVAQVEPAGGWQLQHAYNLAVEHTNGLRSVFPGHEANTHLFGRDAAPPRLPARALTPRTEPPRLMPPADEPIDGEYRPALPATLSEALAAHRGPDLLLGMSGTGEPALWTPQSDPHLGVWGKSGGGKTTRLGLSLAICQITQGWRVLVIDPEQEGDQPSGHWGQLASWAQVVGPGEPGCSLWDELMSWYERRWRSVTNAGATDAWHMPEGKALRPLAVHFDELSRWRGMARKRGDGWTKYANRVDDALAEIGQRGRKRGVHMAVYGQLPGELPEPVAGALTNLTFRQPENQGNKVGYWAAHQLGQGQFAYNGKVYNSFSGLLEAPAILGSREAPKGILSEAATVPNGRSGEESVSIDTVPQVVGTPPVGTWNGGTDDDGRWSGLVDAWFTRNPQALTGSPNGISDLARTMCQHENGEQGSYEDYKSRAHRLYHAFRANVRYGQNYQGG